MVYFIFNFLKIYNVFIENSDNSSTCIYMFKIILECISVEAS